jgi:simple sugar transport system permease protein
VDVEQTVFDAFLVSGALAGVAGAVEVTGVTFALYENLSPGYGYTAIAIALLARLRPIPVILVAIALGGLEAGALAMQREAGVPSGVSSIVEGTLLLLAIAVGSSRLAAAAGPALFRRSTKNT